MSFESFHCVSTQSHAVRGVESPKPVQRVVNGMYCKSARPDRILTLPRSTRHALKLQSKGSYGARDEADGRIAAFTTVQHVCVRRTLSMKGRAISMFADGRPLSDQTREELRTQVATTPICCCTTGWIKLQSLPIFAHPRLRDMARSDLADTAMSM